MNRVLNILVPPLDLSGLLLVSDDRLTSEDTDLYIEIGLTELDRSVLAPTPFRWVLFTVVSSY